MTLRTVVQSVAGIVSAAKQRWGRASGPPAAGAAAGLAFWNAVWQQPLPVGLKVPYGWPASGCRQHACLMLQLVPYGPSPPPCLPSPCLFPRTAPLPLQVV